MLGKKRQDLLLSGSFDIVVLELKIAQKKKKKIYVLNIYNAPVGSMKEGQTIRDDSKYTEFLRKQSILAEDFNLHHSD